MIGFYSQQLQVCRDDISGNHVRENSVQLRGDGGVVPILPAKIVKSKGHRQVIGVVGKTRIHVLTAQILNDLKVSIPVIPGWFDNRSFAKIIPGDDLDYGRIVCHRSSQRVGQRASVPIIQIAIRRSHACLSINIMESRKGAAYETRSEENTSELQSPM